MTTSPVTALTDEMISDLERTVADATEGQPNDTLAYLLADRSELKRDTDRLQKLADMMEMSYGRHNTAHWGFPDRLVKSTREGCTLEGLRAFIDNDFQEQE
jgi:hypothetical protein